MKEIWRKKSEVKPHFLKKAPASIEGAASRGEKWSFSTME